MAPKDPIERSKRKRASDVPKPTKRRRSSGNDEDIAEDPKAKILLMEQGILESKKNYNNIPVLLQTIVSHEDGNEGSALAAVALCRVFVRLLAQGSLIAKRTLSEKDTVVVHWLKEQFYLYKAALLEILDTEELASMALTLCMRSLKAEGEHMYEKEDYSFPTAFLQAIVAVLLQTENEDIRKVYMEEYAEAYDDIRFYTFKSVKLAIESSSAQDVSCSDLFDRALTMLSVLDGVPELEEQLEDFYIPKPKKKTHNLRNVTQHKKQGQESWLAVMRIVEGKDQRKRILNIISTVIAPWFTKPELLADFLTNSYDAGGSMSLLALSGVFYLIQERNLDYPSFYHKLYSLLDSHILHSKHRSRFFRLLDTFLASTHLPAAMVASFIKRFSRLSLNAPPSAVVFVVPWIYNQFRRHPTCTFMMHRETKDAKLKHHFEDHGVEDPFLPDEIDPMKTRAIESCLWEVVQLQSHYHPNVATIAKIIAEQFTKQSYNMEDFLDHSYASLLEAERLKDLKKAPVVEFHIPKRVFLPQDDPITNPDSLLVKLWSF